MYFVRKVAKLKIAMEHLDADKIATELAECRRRGLDGLDRRTTNQAPLAAKGLQELAERHCTARRLPVSGRVSQIKFLLRDGLAAMAEAGHSSEADLLRDLYFGESMDGPINSPGALLRKAQQRAGDMTETRFRERSHLAMGIFAAFLIEFAGQRAAAPDLLREDPELAGEPQAVRIGYVGGNDHFVELLAQAVRVTVVGITNENLSGMLDTALHRKRERGGPDAFWDSLRIVFLGKNLLHAVNDEREEVQDPREALRQRRQDAAWARRSVRLVLKRSHLTRWVILDCPYIPVLTGALLEFGDGRKVAHLLIRRPRRPTPDRLYLDIEDVGDRFSTVFEDIVRNSSSADMIVPVGYPGGDVFRYVAPRLRTRVLRDGSGSIGWLPMVLVITPRRRGDQVEALLQLRTPDNAERELGRVSHLSRPRAPGGAAAIGHRAVRTGRRVRPPGRGSAVCGPAGRAGRDWRRLRVRHAGSRDRRLPPSGQGAFVLLRLRP